MKQINNFDNSRLHNQEDFNFLTRVRDLAAALLTLETDKAMVDSFTAAVSAYDAALKQSDKNSYTAALNEADAKADKRWSAAYAYCKAMMEHPVGSVSTVAAKVVGIFQKYGVLTTLGLDEEYGRYSNLLQDLTALTAEEVTALSLSEWIDAMALAVAQVSVLRADKTKEDSTRQVGIVKDTRTAADAAYKSLVQRVNALVIVNGEAPYADFIDQLNVMIADAQALLASRETKAAKKREKETDAAE